MRCINKVYHMSQLPKHCGFQTSFLVFTYSTLDFNFGWLDTFSVGLDGLKLVWIHPVTFYWLSIFMVFIAFNFPGFLRISAVREISAQIWKIFWWLSVWDEWAVRFVVLLRNQDGYIITLSLLHVNSHKLGFCQHCSIDKNPYCGYSSYCVTICYFNSIFGTSIPTSCVTHRFNNN